MKIRKKVIDVLFDLISESSFKVVNNEKLSSSNNDVEVDLNEFTFERVTNRYTLDFKQRVAFEIMACSYILKTIEEEGITNKSICSFFETDKIERSKYLDSFSRLKQILKQKGGEFHLIMFYQEWVVLGKVKS